LWLYLGAKTRFFIDELKVLDIGPVRCIQNRCRRMKNIEYLSGDLSSPIAMMRLDVTDIALPDGAFDCVFCYHVLEHVADDGKAMRELFRVLRPGGWAIVQSRLDPERPKTFEDPTVVSPEERRRVFGQEDHMRIYGRDYKARLESAGFSVTVDGYVRELDEAAVQTYGLNVKEDVYVCRKG